ncbi:MAG: hypothetical protein P4M11_02820 [Candidatus Pacebacteria bacterium]|nr:hypothetical protein [Candidatus Paceibacterota bacterium]
MFTELTNLLPKQSILAARRHYFLRLATVGVLLLVVLVVIQAVLLMPSYLYARAQVISETAQLNHLTQSLATAQEQAAQAQLAALQTEATYLSRLSKISTASGVIRAILAVPHQGITLNGFTFTAPTSSAPGTMQVSGIASTRETLRSYDQALGALPFVTSANLPISDYAKDSNISFTITLTGSLNP